MRTVDPARTAQRKQQILKAALACFTEKGFHGAGMSAICKKAKMSPGHLYHYFSSKEDLIEALVEQDSQTNEARMRKMLASDNTLDALVQGAEQIWQEEAELHGGLYAEILAEAARNSRIAKVIRRYEEHFQRAFADALRMGQKRKQISKEVDPEGFSILIMGLLNGLSVNDAAFGLDRVAATEATRYMLKRCLGVKNGKTNKTT